VKLCFTTGKNEPPLEELIKNTDNEYYMGEYKFQSLVVYQLSLDYLDQVYDILKILPDNEKFNLCSQLTRASTSIVLNIAEGSTGQSNNEQARFLGMAIRSYIETVACLDLIERRNYIPLEKLSPVRKTGRKLFYKLTKFKNALKKQDSSPGRS
jgi:four helix bundle protein